MDENYHGKIIKTQAHSNTKFIRFIQMTNSSIQAELTSLFEKRSFQSILDRAKAKEISPSGDPRTANIVAAALFQLGRYEDCLLWCEGLAPSLAGDAAFASMHGAALRRVGQLNEAESIFREALSLHKEDKFLNNNFANLLIDKQAFDEGENILRKLIEKYPSYEDAQANLNRLKFQRSLSDSTPKSSQPSKLEADIEEDPFIDPIIAAFSEDEVGFAGSMETKNKSDSKIANENDQLNLTELPERSNSNELQETLRLARQSIDSDPQQVIRDCVLLQQKLGVQCAIYEVAGEAYIRLQLFGDAETTLLIAHGLGSLEGSVLLNLANLSAMRGDQSLALHWLEELAKRQPDHPQLDPVRKTLFANGVPDKSSTPFQINLNQRAPGSFS